MSNSVIIGERLRKIRERQGKTAKQVEKDLNMKQSTYSNYETGKRCPRADVIMDLCVYFDVEPNYIYGVSDIPYSLSAGTADAKQRLEDYRNAVKMSEELARYIASTKPY